MRTLTIFGLLSLALAIVVIPAFGQELVAHFPFNGNAYDESGHGNHGIVSGAFLTEDCSGQSDSAYDFNGVSAYISVPDSPTLRPEEITIAAMLLPRDFGGTSAFDDIVRKQYGANDSAYELGIDHDTGKAVFSLNRGSGNPADGHVSSATVFALGNWYHIACTFDGAEMRIYVNGVLENTLSYSHAISYDSGVVGLGADVPENIHYVDGALDEIRLYDGALTAEEILAIVPECITSSHLVAYYPFNGNASDESGHDNHGVVHGAILTEDCSGLPDKAYDFDGVDDHITVSDSPTLRPDELTIMAMVYPTFVTLLI